MSTATQQKGSGAGGGAGTGGVISPYLDFNGRCEEALSFYTKAIGAKVEMVMKFKDSPESPPPGMLPPGHENKVMHASFTIGDSRVMASDGCGSTGTKFDGFSLSLAVNSEAEVDRAFKALSEGGEVTMPPSKTFWSPRFGMLKDRFGMHWMVGVHPK